MSIISPATAFLLKFSTGGVCEHCGGHCTCDHLELHYLPGKIAPVQENNYLIVCRACYRYIHAMTVPSPQQQALTEQRFPAKKRIFRTILRGQKN